MKIDITLTLETALKELNDNIFPELKSKQGQLSAMLVDILLRNLTATLGDFKALEPELIKKYEALLSKANNFMQPDKHVDLIEQVNAYLEKPKEIPLLADIEMFELIEAIVLIMIKLKPSDSNRSGWLEEFFSLNASQHSALQSAMNRRIGIKSKPSGKEQKAITQENFTTYLKQRFSDYPDISANNVQEVAGGFSKRTYLITISNGPKEIEKVAVRQDTKGGPTGTNVLDEVPALNAAYSAKLPIPKLLWQEKEYFDQPLIALTQLSGQCSIDAWTINGTETIEAFAKALAKLHQLPIEHFIPEWQTPSSVKDYIHHYIESFEMRWLHKRGEPEPVIRYAFEWMKNNIPVSLNRLSIIHGDLSERNIMVDNGRMTGILDWELWHVGDHNEELTYAKPFIEQIIPFDLFLSLYYAHGGPKYDHACGAFWSPWYYLRAASQLATGINTFYSGSSRSIKLLAGYDQYYSQLIVETCNSISKLQ